jgi:hypothetical protein
MELSPSWEATSRSTTPEIPTFLWNPKFYYHVHKNPPLIPILSQMNPVHTNPTYFSKIILIISSHLRLVLPSGAFPSGFSTKTLYAFLHAPPISFSLTYHCNYTWRRVQVMKLLIMQLSPTHKYPLSALNSALYYIRELNTDRSTQYQLSQQRWLLGCPKGNML